MTTAICVTRHGETDWNVEGILQGWTDVPLNAKGRKQAVDLAERFAPQGFDAVWTSPLIRSRETAQIIARQLGLPEPRCHDGLMERNFGVIQGIPKTELAELNPVICQLILNRDPHCRFEQGESMDEFADRVLAAPLDIAREQPGAKVLLITHGWVMDVYTRQIRHVPRHTILHMKRKNGESLWLEATPDAITGGHE